MNEAVICHSKDIKEGQSKGFHYNDINIFIIKKNGQFYAYKNSCPHLGIQLEWVEDQFLDFDNNLIQCSTHGALFTIEKGECVAGPCQGDFLQPVSLKVNDNNELVMLALK
jgi:nitrite reductase/ring-hydroxylating ferredoxin subunit